MKSHTRYPKYTVPPLLLVTFVSLALTIGAPAQAYNRWVDIINETDYVLVELFASNVDDDSWGRDRLGRHVIEPGQSFARNIDDGSGYCWFDFKAVFEDGDVLFDEVNVCDEYDVTYY